MDINDISAFLDTLGKGADSPRECFVKIYQGVKGDVYFFSSELRIRGSGTQAVNEIWARTQKTSSRK